MLKGAEVCIVLQILSQPLELQCGALVSVVDPGLSVRGRIKQWIQNGVGAGGGNAPTHSGMGERCKLPHWGLGQSKALEAF